jgi:hypothetical protein
MLSKRICRYLGLARCGRARLGNVGQFEAGNNAINQSGDMQKCRSQVCSPG